MISYANDSRVEIRDGAFCLVTVNGFTWRVYHSIAHGGWLALREGGVFLTDPRTNLPRVFNERSDAIFELIGAPQ